MKKHNTKFWFKNEKELMKSLGLKGTPGSGNKIIKEDGQNEHLIAQLKSTDGSQITIKLVDVNSLMYNAAVTNKIPIFINQFVDGPVLISMLLKDVPDICKYINGGVKNEKEIITYEEHNTSNCAIIKSGNRKKTMNKIRQERISQYEERRKRK